MNASGNKFTKKKNVEIAPLFLDDQFKHVSAVLFTPCGTISKFNRIGVQAGYGDSSYTLFQVKMCYNHLRNAILPNVFFNHFYKDGLLFSDLPQNSTISSTTWNIKNVPGKMANFSVQTKETINQLMRQFNL